MLASAVITDVRRTLDDMEDSKRWDDDVLRGYLADAEANIFVWRPDLFLTGDGTMGSPSNPSALGDTLTLDEDTKRALCLLVCAMALGEDSDDTGNLRRSNLYQADAMSLLGLGAHGH